MLLHHLLGCHKLLYFAQLFGSFLANAIKLVHVIIKAWKPDFSFQRCPACDDLYMPPQLQLQLTVSPTQHLITNCMGGKALDDTSTCEQSEYSARCTLG